MSSLSAIQLAKNHEIEKVCNYILSQAEPSVFLMKILYEGMCKETDFITDEFVRYLRPSQRSKLPNEKKKKMRLKFKNQSYTRTVLEKVQIKRKRSLFDFKEWKCLMEAKFPMKSFDERCEFLRSCKITFPKRSQNSLASSNSQSGSSTKDAKNASGCEEQPERPRGRPRKLPLSRRAQTPILRQCYVVIPFTRKYSGGEGDPKEKSKRDLSGAKPGVKKTPKGQPDRRRKVSRAK